MKLTVVVCLTLAVFGAVFIGSTSARGSLCDTAKDKVLCAQLTGRAKRWDKAMTNALVGVKKRAEAGKSVADVVAAKLPADMLAITKESIVSTCRDNYDTIMYSLDESLGLVKDDPTSALRPSISTISYFDCTNAISEFTAPVPEATHFDTELLKLDDSLFALTEKRRKKKKQPQQPCPGMGMCV
ncbi:hypothetical protein C2S53_005492 [Perilla frutescens var. hirtella]|uniref:Pectinesterase inhibitor domain-containing protein n=1 Tax=Perilla frutescens var. hirtella TaxID=608512 RepID=A0AAD4J6C9_PERFH|nr:hypothetical protein C2S51_020400 [Perilla frutescens var. frutescens]KAH6828046.1 hypothetical protein C2S53_005492 [Perilla frutescens var. hirtella]